MSATSGLIRRKTPFGADMWCHVGGRIERLETVGDALVRHVRSTLRNAEVELAEDPQPMDVMQWLPDRKDPAHLYGLDPRQHSVSLCFLLGVDGEPGARPGGEAKAFQWFAPAERCDSEPQLRRAGSKIGGAQSLMWQTPGLALTAQAFLMTLALAPGSSNLARAFASGLNIMMAALCFQLMQKHRAMELSDRKALENIEGIEGMMLVHASLELKVWLKRFPSHKPWQVGFVVFGLVSTFIFVTTCARLDLFVRPGT
jgi:ADP-ribose pyrophosphatase YjhB (NUDIX family)